MRFIDPRLIVPAMTKSMFILSLFSFVWTLSMVFGLCFAWRSTIILKTAHIVVGRRRIDVTTIMQKIPHNRRRKSPILQRLLNMKCSELQNAVRNAVQNTAQNATTLSSGRVPLCYMDITYTCPTWGRTFGKTYRYLAAARPRSPPPGPRVQATRPA